MANIDGDSRFKSHLFTVRIWWEVSRGTSGAIEWRGKLQHVETGDTRYFSDLQAIMEFILASLPGAGIGVSQEQAQGTDRNEHE
jgi:hypothetical protein